MSERSTDPPPPGGAPTSEIRTFLIADVRGYTRFTQERGDEAAASLAATFAEIAREGVEAHGGEVIELRGDEALAVFVSAREALRAAVDLQRTYVDEVERRPTMPLRVGIGLDAGEAVPVERGYRGGALNLAARLCSQAGPGQVLASHGVIHLARAVDGLRFVEHGELELKGLSEPVRVLEVEPDDGPDGELGDRLERASVNGPPPIALTELPGQLDPIVPLTEGAARQARSIRWAWRRARRGKGTSMLLLGGAGFGKTRLAAEAAALARLDGAAVALIECRRAGDTDLGIPDGTALLVFDDLDEADESTWERFVRLVEDVGDRPLLVIGTGDDHASDRLGAFSRGRGSSDVLRPRSLDMDGVRAVVALYAGGEAQAPPITAILEASGGVPARVHEMAQEWVRGEAARRLGDAASRAAVGRSDLRALEAELSEGVMDLQLAHERARLYGETAGGGPAIDGTNVSPFKGLESFDVGDADVFFGRERLVAEMVGRLAGSTLLGVVGPSGSGKSSAVRAGLVPALTAGVLPGSEGWVRAVFRPGAYPLRELDRAVWACLPEGLRAHLAGADLPLRAVRDAFAEDDRIVVVVDQFEELFTMCGDEDERAAFVRALVEAATDPRGSAVIVIAVRADFYGRCASYPELVTLLGASHVLVGPMTAAEYARAIEQPARRAGLVIDPELVRRLVSEVVDEPGALPLLSAALLELWQHRRGRAIPWEIYEQTGGVHGAVARLAEDAFGRLDEGGRDVARALFLRLVGQGEGETVVRRRAPLEEFDIERDEVSQVLSVLTDARLVTVSEGAVEVAHEALLREWPRLQVWLEEDRAGQRLRHHITGAASEWDAAGQDAGELYRGARLASALDWTAEHTLELNELERRFLAESRAASERDAERQRRTNRRLRGLLAGVAVLLALALVAGGLALVQRGRAEDAATAATAQRLGAQALVQGDLDLSLLLAREGVNLDDSLETRGNLLAALERSPAAIGIMRPLPGRLLGISSDPAGPDVLVTNNAGQVAVVDPAQNQVLQVVNADFGYYELNGEIVVIQGGGFGRLDPTTGDVKPLIEPPSDWTGGFSSSPDLSVFGFTVGGGSGLRFVDTATGAVEYTWHPDPGRAFIDAWFDTDGRHVLTVEADSPLPADFFQVQRVAYVWRDLATGRAITTIPDPNGYEMIERPQGRDLAVGHFDGGVTLYDLATGTSRDLIGRHNGSVDGIAFSPDGATLATVSADDQAIVWDLATGTIRETLQGHNGPVHGATFSPDGTTLYTSSLDGSLMSWDLTGGRRIDHPFRASGGAPQTPVQSFPSFDVSPDGDQIAVAQADGSVDILDGSTRELSRTIHVGPPGGVLDVVFSPDGKVMASGGENGLVTLWDTPSWEQLGAPLSGPSRSTDPNASESVFDVAFSPDGRTLAAGSQLATGPPDPNGFVTGEGHVYLWNFDTRELVGLPNMVSGAADVLDVAFSPDGSELAAAFDAFGSGDQTLNGGYARVWELPSGKELYTVNVDGNYGHSDAVTFSPDGTLLVTGGGTGDLRFFDARTGTKDGKSVLASAGWLLSAAFDPSGTTIVTAGSDGTTRLIDMASRRQIGPPLPGIDNTGEFARFSPDGTQVIVVYDSGRGYVWDVTPSAWERRACSVAGRQLTRTEWSTFLPDDPYRPVCPR